MKKLYLLRFLSICAFIVLSWGLIDGFLISEAKTSVQLSDDRYNCQGCKCGRPYESDVCTHGDVSICCNMIQALEDEQTEFVVDDNFVDIDLDKGDPISFHFEIQCVDADGHKIDESNCNPATKPTSCDIPDITPIEKKYTVKFNCNGGGGSTASQTYNVGETKALNTNTCTHSTKNFGGWATSSAGTKVYDDGAVVNPGGTAGSTVNLYAVWVNKPTCPAPTITSVDGSNINFNLNGASANTVIVFVSQNKSNWSSSGGPATSPRTFSASYSKGYVKLVTVCSNSVSSADSNIVEFGGSSSSSCFFPTMVIDKVENCAIKYHFNGPDPISGKSCCTAARLDRSLDGETGWWPLTTVYGSPLTGSRVGNNGDSGMIYLRYTYSGCNGEFSPVISYNMPVQSGCPGSSSSMKKTFYNGKCLNWKNNGLYDSNGKLITTISGWKRMGNGYDVRYNSYQSPHWVIWYDNDTTTWGSYSDAYLDYYSDFSKILSAGYSFPLTVYHPGTSNQWHKIVLSNTGYTQSVTQYGIGNLYSSTCTN